MDLTTLVPAHLLGPVVVVLAAVVPAVAEGLVLVQANLLASLDLVQELSFIIAKDMAQGPQELYPQLLPVVEAWACLGEVLE